MEQEIRLKVKSKYVNKYNGGYPLVMQEAITNLSDLKQEGTLFKLVDEKINFWQKVIMGSKTKAMVGSLVEMKMNRLIKSFFRLS